ncbi:MAG: glycosyltransferase [Candidatus Eremiobacterota bacterium]
MRMIWLLLPAFNEEASLPNLLPRIHQTFAQRGRSYRLVVVDDGSTDDTPRLLEEYTLLLPLDVVTHPINRGLGETERDGFEYIASRADPGDLIVRMDCDDTHDPAYIFTLEETIMQGYDVVSTSRFAPGGGQMGLGAYRTVVSRSANIFMQVLFGIKGIRDYSCGYRAYRANIIQDAVRLFGNNFIQLKGLGFTSTLEMLVKLNLMGCRFTEVPFVLRYDLKLSTSKMLTSLTTLGYVIMALLYFWPFDGWKSLYREVGELYRHSPEEAIRKYRAARLKTISRISL